MSNETKQSNSEAEIKLIGSRIRYLRRSQQKTLDYVASKCDFSKSLLSKIETGQIMPSISTLAKIADAMDTSIANLIEQSPDDSKPVFTPREEAEEGLVKGDKGIRVFPFATQHSHNKIQPFLYVAKKGETKPHRDSHEGQEFIYVIRGTLQVSIGPIKYTLREQDSLFFDALDDHECSPISDTVEYLDVIACVDV